MPVGYRSSSNGGTSDTLTSSKSTPVPAGAAAGDIALLALEQWESGNPVVTWPTGFTEIVNLISGSQKLKVAWKRLTGADAGNYTASWTGSQWNMLHCILITGGLAAGDPIEDINTASGTGTAVPTTTVTTATEAFLAHFVASESAATSTPPTDFTEVQDGDYLDTNYRIPGATGSQSASGGSLSASTLKLAALVAIEAESDGAAADATLHVALGIDGSAAKTGQASTTLGIDLDVAGGSVKHAQASATLGLTLGLSGTAATTPHADAELGLNLGIAATAVKRGIADASLGFDLGIAATVGEPVPPSYLGITVGPLRDPLQVDEMRDPMLVGAASGELVTVGALSDTAPTIGELRDEQSPVIGELRDPLAVDEMRDPLTVDELRE